MSQLCRAKLLKSIQSVHTAVVSYANCLCKEIPEKDREIFFKFGLELSVQLQELRKLYASLYQVDPLGGLPPMLEHCCTSNTKDPFTE